MHIAEVRISFHEIIISNTFKYSLHSVLFSCSLQSTLRHHFTQTLTELHLDNNKIGEQGAQHLADALKQNKVTLIPPSPFISLTSNKSFHTDTHSTLPPGQSTRPTRSRTSC